MSDAVSLRVFCLEDNPLIAFHLEHMIEELGHVFAGFSDSFSDFREKSPGLEIDGALVDIDLADGRTGPQAAAWLRIRGIPSLFVTGQEDLAAQYSGVSLGTISKPVSLKELSQKLELMWEHIARKNTPK